MTRVILASLVLAISILPLCAQSTSLHTDRSGYTTGTDGNRTVNTYTDRYGNTTGWVGGKYPLAPIATAPAGRRVRSATSV